MTDKRKEFEAAVPERLVHQWQQEASILHHIQTSGKHVALRGQYLADKAAEYGYQLARQSTDEQDEAWINEHSIDSANLFCDAIPTKEVREYLRGRK